MSKFLAFITNKKYWKFHSKIIVFILRQYGIKVGRNFYCEGVPKLKINGKPNNIVIGNNVSFLGDVDLRNRENGKIILHDSCTLEADVRLVSAREGVIEVGSFSTVCAYAIFNGGADIRIGSDCLIAARVSINANEHQSARHEKIRLQGFVHNNVIIENDCQIGTNVAINKGVKIQEGSIIGANAVVVKDTERYSINVGVPSKKIGERL
jgi:acetyltransferase-like isoleucine patch superfamily enzyme